MRLFWLPLPFPRPKPSIGITTTVPPRSVASLRAPIYEEKVIDFLLELVNVTDKTVSREELMRDDEEETAAAS